MIRISKHIISSYPGRECRNFQISAYMALKYYALFVNTYTISNVVGNGKKKRVPKTLSTPLHYLIVHSAADLLDGRNAHSHKLGTLVQRMSCHLVVKQCQLVYCKITVFRIVI